MGIVWISSGKKHIEYDPKTEIIVRCPTVVTPYAGGVVKKAPDVVAMVKDYFFNRYGVIVDPPYWSDKLYYLYQQKTIDAIKPKMPAMYTHPDVPQHQDGTTDNGAARDCDNKSTWLDAWYHKVFAAIPFIWFDAQNINGNPPHRYCSIISSEGNFIWLNGEAETGFKWLKTINIV